MSKIGTNFKKYICERQMYTFQVKKLGEDGKQIFEGDAHGNNKLGKYTEYSFTAVPPKKNRDGKFDITDRHCFFDATRERLGADYDEVIRVLDKLCLTPTNSRIYSKKDHDKRRNPEAFAISEQLQAKDAELSAKDAEIEALKAKIYGKK